MAALAAAIGHAKANSAYFADLLKDVAPAEVISRAALARLPVTRKSDLKAHQAAARPLGGLNGAPLSQIEQIFMSPGPIYEPGARTGDFWRMGRALYAAGCRAGDLVHNTFSYHMTPAGMMMEAGAAAIGCTVFPAGTGNTEMQLQAMAELRPAAYVGTPSFLKILLEKGRDTGIDLSCLRAASVGGEALPPSLRAELKALGVGPIQSYGTADLGLIAYETPALEGMVVDEGIVLEIVRPGTGDPVEDGEVGEIVVTTFNPVYPLIRFATGDMSAVLGGTSPCGRTNRRIKGWMGRADQTTKVKGMFVHPGQVEQVRKRHEALVRVRLVVDSVDNVDRMTLRCEVAGDGGDALRAAVTETLQASCKLRGGVEFVAPGTLPNDGKVIDDVRTYE
ncbi:phenylacetate--CoA ligase family protein [Oceanibacterium hippocampi]